MRPLILLLFGLLLMLAVPLVAQDERQLTPEEQKDWLVQFLEGQLSTPERQIRISNIEGILSESATIREITISDTEGVWLRIENAAIDWDQAALFSGRLQIRSLSAERIDVLRNPVPSEELNLPPPEAPSFEVPEFPIAIELEALSVPRVTFGEEVFGLGSEISVAGSLLLESGDLDADLLITRLDGPGGRLAAALTWRGEDEIADIDVTLTEPENGILANLLNIPGRPPLTLAVVGSGPLGDLRTEVSLTAGETRVLSGGATITRTEQGLSFDAELRGPLATLFAEPYRDFFGAETSLSVAALLRDSGALEIGRFELSGGQLDLAGSAETTKDGFLRRLQLTGDISDRQSNPVLLPVPGPPIRIDAASLVVDFGAGDSDDWRAVLTVDGLRTPDFTATRAALDARGVALNIEDPSARRLTFNVDGVVAGIASESAEVEAALGDEIGFGMAGRWGAGEPLEIAELRLEGQALSLVLAGTVRDVTFDGRFAFRTTSLEPLSGVAGRELAGAVDVSGSGRISPLTGAFDLALDGTASDLALGLPPLDAVLAGEVRLSGRLARTEQGLIADGFTIANANLTLAADGRIASTAAAFDFRLELADLGLIADAASGPLRVTGTAQGSDGPIAIDLTATVGSGRLADRSLRDASVTLAGTLEAGAFNGDVAGSAFLDGHRLDLVADLVLDEEQRALRDLALATAGASITGSLAQGEEGLLDGRLAVSATDIGPLAALLLLEGEGALEARIALAPLAGRQSADVEASVNGLRVGDLVVDSAELRFSGSDLFGVPRFEGSASGAGVALGGLALARLEADAETTGEVTSFTADAVLRNGADLAAAGSLAALDRGFRLTLEQATLSQGELRAELAAPATLAVGAGTVRLDAVRLTVGSGSITATGTAGDALDLDVAIRAVPLAIANVLAPDLGLAGTLDGAARVFGPAAAPRAEFAVTGSGVAASAIAPYGVAPLRFEARGRYADGTVRLTEFSARGAGGLQLAASGAVPLAGSGLDLAVTGTAPLALAQPLVADRGGQLGGTLRLEARLRGSLADPRLSGTVSVADGSYADPLLNLRLVGISGSGNLAGERLVVDRLTATLPGGGRVAASGGIGLGRGNPVDLRLRLEGARYADDDLVVATVSGELALTGSLARDPLLSGTLRVEEANIAVPETFGGPTALIEVEHIRPAPAVLATLARARLRRADEAGGRPSMLQLDVTLSAPNQVFVRGRGLDAELGGSVRLTGPVSDIRPVGGFSLIRGRLVVLGQRITFESGSVTLVGDLDPVLNLVARTEGDGITVFVTISGRASEPDVTFTSNPALPQDEVLSRLVFNRAMGELSPLQLARLAGAAAELAGGGGSLTDSIRGAAGLADFDIVTDAGGNLAVQAGQYIEDNIYLGVQAGADGKSRVTVNLDITEDLTAKASAGVDGNSSLGIFYETDY